LKVIYSTLGKKERNAELNREYRLWHVRTSYLVPTPSKLIISLSFRKDKVNNVVEYQKVLKECTSNENWNISNTKLQILADHSFNG
jgi:hypothetical protein